MKVFNLKESKLSAVREAEKRTSMVFDQALEVVKGIIEEVKRHGDDAVKSYDKRFSGITCNYEVKVSEDEVQEAYEAVGEEFINSIRVAIKVIESFHREEVPKPWVKELLSGVKVGILPRPVDIAGLYIPGGRAPYPSTALMTAIPARIAGVNRIIACTPPRSDGKANPHVIVALREAGVRDIYKAGGAQAIAAMAYGTKSIPKVNVIAGPGNIYVIAAKHLVSRDVRIDVLAGPSELLVIADETVDPKLVAIDLASQAEHDPLAQVALAATSRSVIEKSMEELRALANESPIVKEVLEKSFIAVYGDADDLIDFANAYAPEHLQLMVSSPKDYLDKIKSAGVILVGPKTPTALSDYCAGPSHVLPTGRRALFEGGLSTLTFIKLIHYVEVEEVNENVFRAALKLAEIEGFKLHAEALRRRLALER